MQFIGIGFGALSQAQTLAITIRKYKGCPEALDSVQSKVERVCTLAEIVRAKMNTISYQRLEEMGIHTTMERFSTNSKSSKDILSDLKSRYFPDSSSTAVKNSICRIRRAINPSGVEDRLKSLAASLSEVESTLQSYGTALGIVEILAEYGLAREKAEPMKFTQYVVEKGDTLPLIAKKHFGEASKTKPIRIANIKILKEVGGITPGMTIRLPPRSCSVYQVVPGDTLSDIAREKLGSASRYPEIYEANEHIDSVDLIFPGQEFLIPART